MANDEMIADAFTASIRKIFVWYILMSFNGETSTASEQADSGALL
jgi:hypothetical protein